MDTFRRKFLDDCLKYAVPYMRCLVLDIGGKRLNRRGTFKPPLENVTHWFYLNINKNSAPNLLAKAENIPLSNSSIDTVLLCEVLEHVEEPQLVISEIYRILKENGYLILSTPFLYRIHADPYDFQRYTDTKLRKILEKSQFTIIELKKNGYFYAVLADFIMMGIAQIKSRIIRKSSFLVSFFIIKWLIHKDRFAKSDFYKSFTTGFFVIAKKNRELF